MNLRGLHHVAIISSNYERSKHFYVNILGLEVVSELFREARHSYKLDLRLPDGVQIELFSFPSPPPRPSYPEACGLRHLAMAVSDLDLAVSHLTQHGIKVEPIRVDELTSKRFTFFNDPDGLPLELYEQ
jgi:glyoxylase I family protein